MQDRLVQYIHKRIVYINNKIPCCSGYFFNDKTVRIDELREILKWLEEQNEN